MKEIQYNKALNEALIEEMDRDEKVFCIGEDIGIYGGVFKVTKGLYERYGAQRVIDTPICEEAIIGTAVGAALMGMRPMAEISFIDFILLAMDQVGNQAAKIMQIAPGLLKMPIVIRTQGGVGGGIGCQHSQSLEALFCHFPGLQVIMPSTPYDAKGLLKSAIRFDGPVVFIENKKLYGIKGLIPEEEYTVPIGKADVKKEGKDITIIATSFMVHESLKAAEELEKDGINAEVVDPRTLVPLDIDTLVNSVKKTKRALIVHEAVERCGIGAEISALLNEKAFDSLDAPVTRLAGLNVSLPQNWHLEKVCIPNVETIKNKVKSILG
ncbi:MAG: alpha-ketoacid dehydrogenase subunit beta [Candidatus Humimicrobiaceae bacterium]